MTTDDRNLDAHERELHTELRAVAAALVEAAGTPEYDALEQHQALLLVQLTTIEFARRWQRLRRAEAGSKSDRLLVGRP